MAWAPLQKRLNALLNMPEFPKEELEISNKALGHRAVALFDNFIGKLHEATLTMTSVD